MLLQTVIENLNGPKSQFEQTSHNSLNGVVPKDRRSIETN